MTINLIPCGPVANESEEKSFAYLKSHLIAAASNQDWILLSNLAFSLTQNFKSDEIDLIAIGPTGVRVIEIKHWHGSWIKKNTYKVENEAERLNAKARKIGTTLRKIIPGLSFVKGDFLLSQDLSKVKDVINRSYRGAKLYHLSQWKELIGLNEPHILSSQQITLIANKLEPKSMVAINGSLRRLAGYINLELQSPKEDRFHRTYRGKHPTRQDKIRLHLYDLSADDTTKSEEKAKRAFEAIRRLQLFPWAPRILDSFQEVPGFPGEMFFFTLVDPEAPPLDERIDDLTWDTLSRVGFAKASLLALKELHEADGDNPLIHRNINPKTLLVKYDNTPIFTGFEYTRIPTEMSIASSTLIDDTYSAFMAPEVRQFGRTAANISSDIYSLCATLTQLFDGRSDELSQDALLYLAEGTSESESDRGSLAELAQTLGTLLGESVPQPQPPPARYWTEDQVVRFRDNDYRIISKLGSGGMGTAFKVVQLARSTKEEMGTYVAKVAFDVKKGQQMRQAYSLVRSYLGIRSLSTVFEVAKEWQENKFIALMKWVPGTSLLDYAGVFSLLAEDQGKDSGEDLALQWLSDLCEPLSTLHNNGLIHGDISPRNLIVSEGTLVLTDYDFVQKIGQERTGPGTILYSAPLGIASPSDDIFALAASFFHILFDTEPFDKTDLNAKSQGLRWNSVESDEYQQLHAFFDKATHLDPTKRFVSVAEVQDFLKSITGREEKIIARSDMSSTQDIAVQQSQKQNEKEEQKEPDTTPVELKEEHILWLKSVLQSYPGSQWGNRETRGLDSSFATDTYVETTLERTLLQDIKDQRIQLVILCGNAGDGKTALLQHLAEQLELGRPHSSERVLERQLPDGLRVRMNLDGSASWKGRSSDEILNDFLRPFLDGQTDEKIFHLLAINDGRLLEWIDTAETAFGTKPLFETLRHMLNQGANINTPQAEHSYIRFINLNERSLVGAIEVDRKQINTRFLEDLLDRLYGGEHASTLWKPCLTCTAQKHCEIFRAARIFGPDHMPETATPEVRKHARKRLFEAFQAVHIRGETHITIRELRSALVYILFGINYCEDYHEDHQSTFLPYWDRAFLADSPARQGEVLGELIRFDPGLEAHPKLDKHLYRQVIAPDQLEITQIKFNQQMASARRQAYFEGLKLPVETVAQHPDAYGLANGNHLHQFLNLPLASEEQKKTLTERLCAGISRLEDLPPQAQIRKGVVSLRVTPRTPTETAFWVEKPFEKFRLEVDLSHIKEIEQLHRQVTLIYHYANGQKERLPMGADLFHLLLELADGYQLGDISSEDTFTRLSTFVQRLVREDDRALFAWTPIKDENIYQIKSTIEQTPDGARQRMVIQPIESGK